VIEMDGFALASFMLLSFALGIIFVAICVGEDVARWFR